MNRRCMGCMEEYDARYDICPWCGYQEGIAPQQAYHITPGSMLAGRYTIGRVLGFGGFGITYIGFDEMLQKKVAVKEYMPSEFSTRMPNQQMVTVYSGDREEQFKEGLVKILEEARRLAKFASEPGIVHIYDCFEANNTAYIVMEYLDGESLKEKISRDGKMTVEEAEPIILSVLSALKKVHEAGIIHRDIAPDNIYLLKNGEVKLLDFGAARYATTKHSKSLSVIIKPGYAPEEQYRSRGDQGPWTDIYALAATFYKLITGITPEDAMERSVRDELKRPSKLGVKINRNTETAIMNALNIKIQDRTQTASDFEAELLAAEVKERQATKDKVDVGSLPTWVKAASAAAALTLTVGFALLAGGVIHFSIPGLTKAVTAEGMTTVPNVINLEVDAAGESVKASRLGMQILGYNDSEEIEKGKILTQNLPGGQEVEEDSIVEVEVSAGGAMTRIPDLIGMSREEAEKAIQAASLSAEYKEMEYQAAPDTIAMQSLPANEQVKVGSRIVLTVSLGKGGGSREVTVSVKNVAGMDYDAASDFLYQDYLYLIKTDSEYSDTVEEGKIISQEPAPGTMVSQQSNIRVCVSLGKEKVEVPNATYLTLEEAKSNLEAALLEVSVTEEYSDVVPKGNTISQSIERGELVEKGTEVKVAISLGPKPVETKPQETKADNRPRETTGAARAPQQDQPSATQAAAEPTTEAPTQPPVTEAPAPPTTEAPPTQAPQDNGGMDLNKAYDIFKRNQ